MNLNVIWTSVDFIPGSAQSLFSIQKSPLNRLISRLGLTAKHWIVNSGWHGKLMTQNFGSVPIPGAYVGRHQDRIPDVQPIIRIALLLAGESLRFKE